MMGKWRKTDRIAEHFETMYVQITDLTNFIMIKRIVTATAKDKHGDITCLCNITEGWLRVTKEQAIDHIDQRTYKYYARGPLSQKESEIEVVNGPYGRYLRTVRDGISSNNLDKLPDC